MSSAVAIHHHKANMYAFTKEPNIDVNRPSGCFESVFLNLSHFNSSFPNLLSFFHSSSMSQLPPTNMFSLSSLLWCCNLVFGEYFRYIYMMI